MRLPIEVEAIIFRRNNTRIEYLLLKRLPQKNGFWQPVTGGMLQNPRLRQITFHTLRHWKATMEYHRTKDILFVKQLLGHTNINATLIYTHLIDVGSDEYHVRAAKTIDEAKELLEVGFEYVTDMDDIRLFRKRK